LTYKFHTRKVGEKREWYVRWWCDFCTAKDEEFLGSESDLDYNKVLDKNHELTKVLPGTYATHILNECPAFKRMSHAGRFGTTYMSVFGIVEDKFLICDGCKSAANPLGDMKDHCGEPGEKSQGCFCQHHPVGSLQIAAYNAAQETDPGRKLAWKMLANAGKPIQDLELPVVETEEKE